MRTLRVHNIAIRSFGFEFMFLHSPSGVMLGEREISELRSPNSLSPNVPQSLLGDASNPNKSDVYLAGSRRYIPDLTSGLLLCTAVRNLNIYF